VQIVCGFADATAIPKTIICHYNLECFYLSDVILPGCTGKVAINRCAKNQYLVDRGVSCCRNCIVSSHIIIQYLLLLWIGYRWHVVQCSTSLNDSLECISATTGYNCCHAVSNSAREIGPDHHFQRQRNWYKNVTELCHLILLGFAWFCWQIDARLSSTGCCAISKCYFTGCPAFVTVLYMLLLQAVFAQVICGSFGSGVRLILLLPSLWHFIAYNVLTCR